MPKEKAKEEWKLYNNLIKKRHDAYLKDMKNCMYQLSQGKALIDIYKVMEKIGVNKTYQPKLAIARADWRKVYFNKRDQGRGFFSDAQNLHPSLSNGDIDLIPETFMHWKRNLDTQGRPNNAEWGISNRTIFTKIPLIPAQLIPDGALSNYYILWEVDLWADLPKTDDPLLLKRITENLFVILAAWDVTNLEQSIISGLK